MAITTVFVTHDQQEALTLSDRVAVLNAGRLEQASTPDALYERPQTRFVADFVGESNIIEASVTTDGAGRVAVTSDGLRVPIAPGEARECDRVAIVLRPEKLRFAAGAAGTIAGKVEQVIFGGETSRFQVRVSAQRLLTVKQQNRADGIAPKPGETCALTWSPNDMIVLAASG
jgi:ABC-type Fe3+/spermidine/putrescine transport system ATPase subunit